jgi:putative MATE family efflux protein
MKGKKKYTGIELMETAPVGTAILRLALPMVAAMLAHAIYNMTDLFFIGQTKDPNMVAAVSLAFPLFMLSQALGNIFATGGSSYISRMLGEKKNDEARHTSAVSFLISFGIGFLLTAVFWILKTPTLRLLGASDATYAYTDEYFSVVVLFMAIASAGTVMCGQMRSEGATKEAMILQLIGISLNIVLDPIFILWFHMGTAGAAWATVAGIAASFIYGLFYFLSKKTILSIKPKDFKPNKWMLVQMMSIGVPAGLSNIVMSVSSILGNRIAASYGDFVIAGNGVQMRVSGLFFMLIFALAMGFQPFPGFNYGARQFDRLRRGFKLTALYATGLCIAGSAILGLFGPSFIRFFIEDAQTIEAGTRIMRIFIWGLPFVGVQITLMVTFQALGKSMQAMVVTLGRQLLFYIPLLFMLNRLFGFKVFIWAQPAADILTTGIAAVMGISLLRLMRGTDGPVSFLKSDEEMETPGDGSA